MKKVLLGNEVFAYAVFMNGVNVVTGYPGTPSTEVIETLKNFEDDDFYIEWSVNEKVALELAAGASLSGARSVVCMKQVGMNVAADPLLSLSMVGIEGGMIVFVADDPGPHSSQTEQDTRHFAKFCNLPVFDPSSPSEIVKLVPIAFAVSEEFKIPVIFRMTTRICHSSESIDIDFKRKKHKIIGFSKKSDWIILPSLTSIKHNQLEEKLNKISSTLANLNISEYSGKIGIVTSGVSFHYVKEAIKENKEKISIFKVTVPHPFAKEKFIEFAKDKESLIFFEELDPVVEEEAKIALYESNIFIPTYGKRNGYIKYSGEFDTDYIQAILFDLFGISEKNKSKNYEINIPKRASGLCAGCPHRNAFLAVKNALKDKNVIFTGDIGCYTLGFARPINATDTCLCMGASITMGQGIQLINKDALVVAFIGDSTFFHSGITGLINAVYNTHRLIICILDNLTTGMTGHQPHPGIGIKVTKEEGKKVSIEEVVAGCGIQNVIVLDPYSDFNLLVDTIANNITNNISVFIFRRECISIAKKKKYNLIEKDKCIGCLKCINQTGCPALIVNDKKVEIDTTLCYGCGLCKVNCRFNAITEAVILE